jgi:tetratricopeptide (TPR) repeat protein
LKKKREGPKSPERVRSPHKTDGLRGASNPGASDSRNSAECAAPEASRIPIRGDKEAEPGAPDDRLWYEKASLLKIAALAAALGVATWLLVPFLLPSKLPEDFPRLPDLGTVSPAVRAALQDADREARRRPGSAAAVGKLGMAYHANSFGEQAVGAYRIAARLAPGDYRWAHAQAVLAEENGNNQEQWRLLQQILRLQPRHALSLLKTADFHFKVDRLEEAAHYYEMAAGEPGKEVRLQAAFGLGRVAARRRDWAKVIEYAAPLSRAYPNLRPPYDLLEEAYEALGQPDKAAEARQGAALAGLKVVPPPDDPLSEELTGLCFSSTRLLKQAGVLSRTGRFDRAIEVARRAISVDSADADARSFLAQTLLSFYGDKPDAVEEALTQLGECLRLRPDDPTPLWTFTAEFTAMRRAGAAVERLHTLMLRHAGRPEAHLSLGLIADARGDTDNAVLQYEAALQYNPGDSVAHNMLGQLYDKAGKYSLAAAHFQKSIQLNPSNAVLHRNFGIALVQQENYSQAIKEFGEALRVNPYDTPTLISMGFAFLNLNRAGEAIPKFRDALRSRPDSAEGHYGLGFAFFAQGRPAEALPEVREALRLLPAFPEANALLQKLGQ